MHVLDSHLHLWDPAVLDYDWLAGDLRRRFGPGELAAATRSDEEGTTWGFVAVQAECAPEQSLAEVDWISGLAAEAGVRGIVARAALEQGSAVRDDLAALASRPLVRGVRRLLQDEPAGFARQPAFVAGAREVARAGLVFDACVRAPQLDDVVALADAVPELAIVLDHLGKPQVGSPAVPGRVDGAGWAAALRSLAERPNVVVKLSGLPAESAGDWSPAQLDPFLEVALDAFGPTRLMFGTDWPVSRGPLAWRDYVADRVGAGAVDDVFRRTAERVYRLG
jgi:L-fuconolactonase